MRKPKNEKTSVSCLIDFIVYILGARPNYYFFFNYHHCWATFRVRGWASNWASYHQQGLLSWPANKRDSLVSSWDSSGSNSDSWESN